MSALNHISTIPRQAARNALEVIRTRGGATLDARTMSPVEKKSGFFVSIKGFESKVPKDQISINKGWKALQDKAIVAQSRLGAFVGAWIENGDYYFDVSIHVEDKAQAIAIGRRNDQRAIFDVANGTSIYLNQV